MPKCWLLLADGAPLVSDALVCTIASARLSDRTHVDALYALRLLVPSGAAVTTNDPWNTEFTFHVSNRDHNREALPSQIDGGCHASLVNFTSAMLMLIFPPLQANQLLLALRQNQHDLI